MTDVAIDATELDHITCRRCGTLSPIGTTPCARCGVALGGEYVYIETATRIRLLDALAAGDLDEMVRVTLAAHADGLLEVAR